MAISGALIWEFESEGAALYTGTLLTLGVYSEVYVRQSKTKFRINRARYRYCRHI